MATRIRIRQVRELIEAAETYCDHQVPEDHAKGHCDYVVISQEDLSQLLDGGRDGGTTAASQ